MDPVQQDRKLGAWDQRDVELLGPRGFRGSRVLGDNIVQDVAELGCRDGQE